MGSGPFILCLKPLLRKESRRSRLLALAPVLGQVVMEHSWKSSLHLKARLMGIYLRCSKQEPLLEPSPASSNQSKQLWGAARLLSSLSVLREWSELKGILEDAWSAALEHTCLRRTCQYNQQNCWFGCSEEVSTGITDTTGIALLPGAGGSLNNLANVSPDISETF